MIKLELYLVLGAMLLAVDCQDYSRQNEWGGECLTGQKQSPVSILSEEVDSCSEDFSFELSNTGQSYHQSPYDPLNINLLTNFTNSIITVTKGSQRKTYNSLQFHLHHMAEHLIDGRQNDLELHILHQSSADQAFAVYGVLFEAVEGSFSDPFDNWNLNPEITVTELFPIPLETPPHVFHYSGSLTTPACTEGVQWFINHDVVKIKKTTLEKVAKLINHGSTNNRKVQDLNGRHADESGSACSPRRSHLAKRRHHLRQAGLA